MCSRPRGLTRLLRAAPWDETPEPSGAAREGQHWLWNQTSPTSAEQLPSQCPPSSFPARTLPLSSRAPAGAGLRAGPAGPGLPRGRPPSLSRSRPTSAPPSPATWLRAAGPQWRRCFPGTHREPGRGVPRGRGVPGAGAAATASASAPPNCGRRRRARREQLTAAPPPPRRAPPPPDSQWAARGGASCGLGRGERSPQFSLQPRPPCAHGSLEQLYF